MYKSSPTKIVTTNLDAKIRKTDFQYLLLWTVYSRRFYGVVYTVDEIFERAISAQRISPAARPMITKFYWKTTSDNSIHFYKVEELFFDNLEQRMSADFDFSENRIAKDAVNWILESIEIAKREKDNISQWFDSE